MYVQMEGKRLRDYMLESDKHRKHKYKPSYGKINEGQGFAEERKRKAQNDYLKLQKKKQKGKLNQDVESSVDVETTHSASHETHLDETPVDNDGKIRCKEKKNLSKFSRAESKFQKQKAKEDTRKQEIAQDRHARDRHLQQYKNRKQQRNRKLSKRTPKGQPIMKHHMKFLLQKIEAQMGTR